MGAGVSGVGCWWAFVGAAASVLPLLHVWEVGRGSCNMGVVLHQLLTSLHYTLVHPQR